MKLGNTVTMVTSILTPSFQPRIGIIAMTENVMKMIVISAIRATMMFIVAKMRIGKAVQRPTIIPMKAEFVRV